MATEVSKGLVTDDLLNPDLMSQAEANAGVSPVERLVTAEIVATAMAFYKSQEGPAADYEHLWYTSDYTTMYKDSYQSPAAQLTDQSANANNISVNNPNADGIDTRAVIPIIHSTSSPDGLGMLYPADVPAWTSDLGEFAELVVGTAIDINGNGAISFGGWAKTYSFSDGFQGKSPYAQQGGAWNNVQVAPANNTLAAYMEVDAIDPLAPTQKFGVYAYFDTAGIVELKSNAHTFNEWTHVWYQITDTRMEIWIDFVLDKFVDLAGDTLNISTTNNFRYCQSVGTNVARWAGGIGKDLYMYDRMLTATEISRFVKTNIDMGTKILVSDVGAVANPSTHANYQDPWTWYYPGYKTASTWTIDADTGTPLGYSASGARSVRLHLATPIYRGGAKVECQYRVIGDFVTVTGGYLAFGFDMKERGEYTTSSNFGPGDIAKSYAIDTYTLKMQINGVWDGVAARPQMVSGDIMTLRIDPTDPINVLYEFLLNNVSVANGSIATTDFEAHGRIYMDVGRNQWGPYEDQQIHILSNEVDAAYPIGAGYKFLESV